MSERFATQSPARSRTAPGSDILPTRHAGGDQRMRAIQHVLGNQAVQRIARSSDGGPLVHAADSPHEHEAQRMAARVAGSAAHSAPHAATPAAAGVQLQRAHAGADTTTTAAPTATGTAGEGMAMDNRTRAEMEGHFGRDLGAVRLHTGERAAHSAAALGADAYTAGNDIVFAHGKFQPETHEGRSLLAHELTHVVQQAPGVFRQTATTPAQQQPAATCTPAKPKADILKDNHVKEATQFRMERAITMASQHSPVKFSKSLLAKADTAIQAELGSYITKTTTFAQAQAKPSTDTSVKEMKPDDYAAMRIPGDSRALEIIADIAFESAPEAMAAACITSSSDSDLISSVAQPILTDKKLDFVRKYLKSTEGGRTTFGSPDDLKSTVSVSFQSEVGNLGHVIVHEAMHYYVADAFRVEARKRTDHAHLMEGGAEFFARNVISNQLAGDPDFAINQATYRNHISYIAGFSIMQRTAFPAMYFQGRTDLMALIAQP